MEFFLKIGNFLPNFSCKKSGKITFFWVQNPPKTYPWRGFIEFHHFGGLKWVLAVFYRIFLAKCWFLAKNGPFFQPKLWSQGPKKWWNPPGIKHGVEFYIDLKWPRRDFLIFWFFDRFWSKKVGFFAIFRHFLGPKPVSWLSPGSHNWLATSWLVFGAKNE